MVYGTVADGNEYFHCPDAPVGVSAKFTFRAEAGKSVCTMDLMGAVSSSERVHGAGRIAIPNVDVYVADPWYTASDATIEDFDFEQSL